MEDNTEDLTTAYMLGKCDGRKEAQAANSRCSDSAGSDCLQNASDKAEKFICEWTCAESLEEMKRDSWSTSDVHSILMDFILSQNIEGAHGVAVDAS